MRDALVFNGDLPLGFCELRQSLARLPEALARLNEAQRVCDDLVGKSVNLLNCVGEDHHGFASVDPQIKKLLSLILSVALLDRYLSRHQTPQFLVTASAKDVALRVMTGQSEFIRAICGYLEIPGFESRRIVCEEKFEIHLLKNGNGLGDWIGRRKIERMVTVGPLGEFWTATLRSRIHRRAEITDIIRLDPTLKWFWAGIRGACPESAI